MTTKARNTKSSVTEEVVGERRALGGFLISDKLI
jgi:hypothetical protein